MTFQLVSEARLFAQKISLELLAASASTVNKIHLNYSYDFKLHIFLTFESSLKLFKVEIELVFRSSNL